MDYTTEEEILSLQKQNDTKKESLFAFAKYYVEKLDKIKKEFLIQRTHMQQINQINSENHKKNGESQKLSYNYHS